MIPKRFIDYYGDDVRWFVGNVVSLDDPKQIGRMRVRIYGVHPESTVDVPDDDLPWASVAAPITSGSNGGVGAYLGVQVNSLVFGFFLDGQHSQLPLVLGAVTKDGDSNPLATGTQTKEYTPDETIGEPDDPYAAVYPNNLVYETSAGHVKEYDNTDSAERIRELHKSGTFYQVNPDGDFVEHIVKDRYTVIAGNDAIHVTGNVNIFVDTNANITVGGNVLVTASDGTVTIDTPSSIITGDVQIDGNVSIAGNVTTDGSHTVQGEVTGKGIALSTHTHLDTPGLGAGTTTPPLP
jgi:hypothetical protein